MCSVARHSLEPSLSERVYLYIINGKFHTELVTTDGAFIPTTVYGSHGLLRRMINRKREGFVQ